MKSRLWGNVLFCFSLLIFSNSGFCRDDGRISGSVKSISGSPLGDAVIKIFKSTQRRETLLVTRSDRFGFFRQTNLSPGTYYLQVSRNGYEPVTTAKFAIDHWRSRTMSIVLENILGFVSNDDDPRNQDLKDVMRGASDRRMIFRNIPGEIAIERELESAAFNRLGAFNLASSSYINNESYYIRPQSGQNGITSNFAFSEPINQRSRMILSGQVDFGFNSFWRLRNTYNYRPDSFSDYRISVGYGRMNPGDPRVSSPIPSQLFPKGSGLQESGVQTLAFGMEGTTRFLDVLSFGYGFDYSRLNYGKDLSFTYPSLKILIKPLDGWSINASISSRRLIDEDTVILPNGEQLNLSEPTLITMVDNKVSMSQVRHSEFSVERIIDSDTAIEVAVYGDQTRGPGIPIKLTAITSSGYKSSLVELNEDHASQQGTRITINRKLFDNLKGSLAYVYGEATDLASFKPVSAEKIDSAFLKNYARQRYHHSITGKIDVTMPATKTNLLATIRWYPDNPFTPIDWFSDRMNIGTKSVNLEFRQMIPTPELLGNTGKWEVLIDLRNMLNQGRDIISASNGELIINRNPRSLRFGFSLNFR
jgi:hypothetical protein